MYHVCYKICVLLLYKGCFWQCALNMYNMYINIPFTYCYIYLVMNTQGQTSLLFEISQKNNWRVGIPLTCLTLPCLCACPKPGPEFPSLYVRIDCCIGSHNHCSFIITMALFLFCGFYGFHLTMTTVCTPEMYLGWFLFPSDCRFLYIDFQ
jgi:hypothetical protein